MLQKIPLETIRFAVITFEHDYYCSEDKEVRENSRKYLESFGYTMVANDLSEDRYSPFEDWWVHPELVSEKIIDRMRCLSAGVKRADDYMLGRI